MSGNYVKVVLVGPRAAGKTTLGPELAGELGLGFRDGDDLVAAAVQQPAEDYLQSCGEDRFRAVETRVTREALESSEEEVLALGGGSVTSDLVRHALQQPGRFVVFVYASLDVLTARQKADPRTPLTGLGPEQEVAALLAARRELYREVCDMELDTSSANVRTCIRSIMDKMASAS